MKNSDLSGKQFGDWTVLYRVENRFSPNGKKITMYRCRCSCGTERDVRAANLISGKSDNCGHKSKINLVGKQYGYWTVIDKAESYISPKGANQSRWLCQCICGKQKTIFQSSLCRGKSTSCGCMSANTAHKKADLTGRIFGNLVVVRRVDDYVSPRGARVPKWLCKCQCGNEIEVISSSLRNGDTKSCGCLNKKSNKAGISGTKALLPGLKKCTTYEDAKTEKRNRITIDDVIGKQFGNLTILSCVEKKRNINESHFLCRCTCGEKRIVTLHALKKNNTISCGCLNRTHWSEIEGRKYGELTVESCIEKRINLRDSKFLCRCSCGKERIVSFFSLKNNPGISCGCKNQAMSNVVGSKYGDLTVLEELPPHITPNGSKQRIVRVKCSCGNVYETRLSSAKQVKRCRSCQGRERRVDISGKRFGMLVVTSMADDYVSPSGHRLSRCNCICDCGKSFVAGMSQLVTGQTRSCGCLLNTKGMLLDFPELMSKYDFEKNNALGIDVNSITARTSRKVWWKCATCGNSWFATVASQNDRIKHGCPYCSGRLVVKGKTDLLSQFPNIADEWDFEKNEIGPDEVSRSSSVKYWWKCKECGHTWKQTVANRTGNKSGCPRCNIENVNSFCEQAVLYYVRRVFPDAINGDKHLGMELDIYIPSIKTAIEYDGEVWHESKKKTTIDERKNKLCETTGVKLYRIREPRLKSIDGCITIVREDSTTSKSLDRAIISLMSELGINDLQVNTEADGTKIMEQYAQKKSSKSLASCSPDIAKEWHPTKNGVLTPEKVNNGTTKKVWWLGKCGHEWLMRVNERTQKPRKQTNGKTRKPYGCPYCSGKRILIGFNDLKTSNPELAEEWHPQRNAPLMPTDFTSGSRRKVWWLGKCGHEWQQAIGNRARQGQGCPICFALRKSPNVICIETGTIFSNGQEAADFAGLKGPSSIYSCCREKSHTAGGYHWKYTNEQN